MKKHNLSPSSAERWTNCIYSAYYEKDAPYESSPAAERGTALHTAGAEVLKQTLAAVYPETRLVAPRQKSEEREAFDILDMDDLQLCATYADTVVHALEYLAPTDGPPFALFIEQCIKQPPVVGIVDFYALLGDPLHPTALVIDLKTGEFPVHAHENHQLLTYAMCIPAAKYYGMIIQPGALDSPPVGLLVDGPTSKDIVNAVTTYQQHDYPPAEAAQLGPWCTFCRASASCPKKAAAACDAFNAQRHRGEIPKDPDGIGDVYKVLKHLDGQLDEVKKLIRELDAKGVQVPGTMVAGSDRRKFSKDADPADIARMLGLRVGDIADTEPRLHSPSKVEKLASIEPVKDWIETVRVFSVREA